MSRSSIDISAFASLKAEKEPWLPQVFLPPRNYAFIAAADSALIYSPGGGGKSALLHMLAYEWQDGKNGVLVVQWRPELPAADDVNARDAWLNMLFSQMGFSLLEYLIANGELINQLPNWAAKFLEAFLSKYRPPWFELELLRLMDNASQDARDWLERYVAEVSNAQKLFSGIPVTRTVSFFLKCLDTIGLSNMVVLIDGLEGWEATETDYVSAYLTEFLSMLALFEFAELSFKLALPLSWRQRLRTAGVVSRRRASEFMLEWTQEELVEIANRRLTWSAKNPDLSLSSLCPNCNLIPWLTEYGGHSPRQWLSLTAGIVRAYIENEQQPISLKQWQRLKRQLLPRLRITADNRIFIGERELTGIASNLRAVLRYLYEHDHRICSREELYYRAYRGYHRIPDRLDVNWESPASWRGAFDMVISRLRSELEPDPNHPKYIITYRGQGIKLNHIE